MDGLFGLVVLIALYLIMVHPVFVLLLIGLLAMPKEWHWAIPWILCPLLALYGIVKKG